LGRQSAPGHRQGALFISTAQKQSPVGKAALEASAPASVDAATLKILLNILCFWKYF
jgi:hypothetical protein